MSSFKELFDQIQEENSGRSTTPGTASQTVGASGTGGSSGGNFMSLFKEVQLKNSPTVDNAYINKYLSDSRSFLDRMSASRNWQSGRTAYDDSEDDFNDLSIRSSAIKNYLRENQVSGELADMIDNASRAIVGSRSNLRNLQEFYNQWDNEDDYNAYADYVASGGWLDSNAATNEDTVAKRQARYKSNADRIAEIKEGMPWYGDTFLPSSIESVFLSDEQKALKEELDRLEAENRMYDRTQGVLDRYYTPVTDEFAQNASFRDYKNASRDELRNYDAAMMEGVTALSNGGSYDQGGNIVDANGNIVQAAAAPAVEDKLGMFLSASDDDIVEAYDTLSMANGNYANTWANLIQEGDVNGWKHLTDYEVQIYYDLYKREGQKAAYQYLEDMSTELTRRETQANTDYINSTSGLEQVGWNVASIPMNVVGGLASFVDDASNILQGKDINPYSRAHSLQNAASDIRGKTSADINEATGNAALPWVGTTFGDVYQALMSAADSATGLVLGSTGYGVLMGMGAASSEMKDLYDQGASLGQIATGGVLAGAAEMVFEKYSIDQLVSMGDSKAVKDIVINLLKQGGVEASEEVFTEIANTITNAIVMGSQSDWVDMQTFVKNVVNAGIGGFISGGVMGGIGSTAGFVNYGNQAAKYGQDIINHGDIDSIRQIAADMSADPSALNAKQIGKLAGKVSKNTSARNVGMLTDLMGETVSSQNTAEIQSALEEKGLDGKDAARVAEYLNKAVQGGTFTDAEAAEVEADDRIAEVYLNFVGDSKSSANTRTRNLYSAISPEAVATTTEQPAQPKEIASTENTNTTTAETPAESHYESSVEGKTILKSTGETVSIKEIASIKDGKMTLKLDDGRTVDASNVSYSSQDEALVYEAVAEMGTNAVAADMLVKAYTPGGISAEAYAHGIKEAYTYGQYNYPVQEVASGPFSSMLTEYQRQTAYKLGQIFSGKQAAKEQATVLKNQAVAKNTTAAEKSSDAGKVHFDRNGRTFDDVREVSLKTMEQLSAALGVEFYVFESYVNESGQRVYKDENSKEVAAPNGFYDPKDGSIHIDLNAGRDGKGTMLFTVAHELTHFIRQWSPAKFKVLANFLNQQYGEKGKSVSALVDEQIAKAKRNGRTISYAVAYEEVVADSMESMLTDGNVVQMMADLKQQDKSLWQKICDWFKDLVSDLKAIVDAYTGKTPDSVEGKMVADMQDVIVILESLYADALVDASENRQGATNAEKNTTQEGGAKFQTRNVNGDQVVWIEANILKENKGLPVHQFVANYIAEHIGEVYTIIESGQKVYIGQDLPGEYTQSKYTKAILRNNPNIARAKNRASANLGEMIEIATNRRWEKTKHHGSKDAKYGMYRYDTRFGFPVKDTSGRVTGANVFRAELLIRNASDGKKYLYDIVSIKKDTASSDWLTRRVTSAAGKAAGQKGVVFKANVAQKTTEVNKKFSSRDSNGNTLTAEQQEYFKDSEARDGRGQLLVLYHQTNADFTIFDTRHEGAGSRDNETPFGIFLKRSDSDIGLRGKKQMTLYANITNPLRVTNREDLVYRLRHLSPEYGTIADEIRQLDSEYHNKYEAARQALHDFMTKWRQENPGASRRALYDVPEFNALDDAEDDVIDEWTEKQNELSAKAKESITAALREAGYDGVFIREDVGSWGRKTDAIIALDPAQVKNVDNTAPTSDPDIRFSERDPEQQRVNRVLEKENAKLKEDVTYLKELLKLQRSVTGGKKFTRTSVEAAATKLMKDASARGQKAELVGLLNGFYEYIAAGEELTWEGVVEQAQPVVRWLQTHESTKKQTNEYAADILRELRGTRISLDDLQKKEVAYQYGSFNEFRKKTMGSIIVTNSGTPLDVQWIELSRQYPHIFNPETTSNDMPAALLDAINNLRNMPAENEFGYDQEMAAQDLLHQVYDSYWSVSTLYTVADVKQREINRLKSAHHQRMADLRETHRENTAKLKQQHSEDLKRVRQEMRAAADAKQQKIVQKYQESRQKGIESRNKTAMRHKIQNAVKELNDLLLNESKKRHVPDSLKKAVADALALVNMDTAGAEERAAKYANLIDKEQAKANPDQAKIDSYTMSMENILRQGEKMGERLKDLRDAYEEISASDDPDIAHAYDPVIAGNLKELAQTIGNTSLRNMTIEQLSDVYDMYRMVLTRVRDANKSFLNEKKESISNLASRVVGEVRRAGGEHAHRVAMLDPVRKFLWNNLKPVYAFEHLGSDTLTEAFNSVRKGEDTWAVDVTEAREYYLDKSRKYGYNSWDFKKKYRFESDSGIEFELTLEQILSLYAYSKREQAHDHLRLGGFVFDSDIETTKENGKLKYKVNTADAHQITPEILADIIGKLTDEQMAFVDEMQDYLSTVMGAKGNEVTMQMYGVKLFKEKFYFPLKSARQFMFEQNEVSGEVRIKNSGFTNKIVAKANNPVILNNFMDVWAGHVNDMSMYHAFVLPLEDFNRIFNYNSPKKEGQPPVSVKGTIQSAYSPAAVSYVKELITDLNGGARTDSTTGIINKGMGLFKKGAVFASASVVIQQPSAIARAAALIDTKYFIGPKVDHKKHKALWAEVKQYAPVAIIKEMGYFDTNMGKSTQDFILSNEHDGWIDLVKRLDTKGLRKNAKDFAFDSNYRDEILSRAPAWADEKAWCLIWEAVKRETMAKNPGMKANSEEFLQKAGQRFTEIITKTQVYDSVLSRSALMRSKDTGMKMATAFMAEPTTSINMIADALLKGKRGNRKYARGTIGAVIASQILNSILVSFVYAGRDDDEDKTYLEKYLGTLAGETLDSLNPATYIPFIKDIVSIVRGYDVERSDMAVVSDLWNAWQKLGSDKLSPYRKVEGFVGSIAQIFGLPVKNIMRDARGIYQAITSFMSGQKTTGAGIGYAVKSAVTGQDTSNQQQLYEAYLSGDKTQISRVEGRFKDQSAINSAIRAALRENDSRIYAAAVARSSGNLTEYTRLAKEIIAEGHFSQDNVVAAINAEINAMKKDDTASTPKTLGLYKAEDFATAISGGDSAMASAVRDDIIQTAQKNGKTADDAEKNFISDARSSMKDLFLDKGLTETQAINALIAYCGETGEEARKRVAEWAFEEEFGFTYGEKIQKFKDGTISAAELKGVLIDVDGKTADEAASDIVDYSRDGYEAGDFSRAETVELLMDYGGLTRSEAESKLRYIDFKIENPDVYADDSWIDKYYAEIQPSGISIDLYVEYRSRVKSMTGSDKKAQRMAVIDSLPVSNDQKDALYFAEGWASSRLYEAPWR